MKKKRKSPKNIKYKNVSYLEPCWTNSPHLKSITLPIRLLSEANLMEHWAVRDKRRQEMKDVIRMYWKVAHIRDISLPITITLTRLAPRTLDSDNLVTAFKSSRDTIADLIIPGLQPGRADDNPDMEFVYKQEKSKAYGINIRISNEMENDKKRTS